MRLTLSVTIVTATVLAGLLGSACTKKASMADDRQEPVPRSANRAAEPDAPAEDLEVVDNPTTAAGRGTPKLDSLLAHAAWIYIDEQEGQYIEKDGQPQIQWTIYGPVSRNPTFRVEAYKPLLGEPHDFQCALQTYESYDGSSMVYAIKAKAGTFEVGKVYSLLEPGENFTIIDKKARTTVDRIPLLAPGVYGLVGGVSNSETKKEAMAITYFTVGAEEKPAGENSDGGKADQ
ncbi:MAG: hypothetical protein ACE5E5_11785 [Phycisphaerae bacterium]